MKKNIYFMIFPILIIVLMIIIFIFDKRSKKIEETEPSTVLETVVTSTAAATMVEKLADFDTFGLQEDAVPEVKSVILEYQNAKLQADAAKMLSLYGKTVEDANLTAGLENDKRLYQKFEDTKTYMTNGVIADSYLVFISTKIKFHFVDTLAPSLTWTYVQKQEDGTLILKDPYNLTTEETAFVRKVASSDVVKSMSDQTKKDLAAAVISDARLANVYRMLSGSSVTSGELPEESSDATTAAGEMEVDAQISIISESGETSISGESMESTETTAQTAAEESVSDASEGTGSVAETSSTDYAESVTETSAQ